MFWFHLSWITVWFHLMFVQYVPLAEGTRGRGPRNRGTFISSLPPLPSSKLQVLTIQNEPYITLNWMPGLIGNERYSGFYSDLLREFCRDLDITYQLSLVGDGQMGTELEGGIWTGLIGQLTRGEADMALAPILATSRHERTVSLSVPINHLRLTAILRRPLGGRPSQIRNFQDLIHQTNIAYGVVHRDTAWQILRHTNDNTLQTLYRNIQANSGRNVVNNVHEAFARVRRTNFALVMEKESADYYIKDEPCDLITTSTFDVGQYYAMGFQNNSVWLPLFDQWITTVMANRRRWQQLRSKFWNGTCAEGMSKQPELSHQLQPEIAIQASSSTVPPINLVMTTILKPPYVMRATEGNPQGAFEGYIVDLVSLMSQLVPFDYQWRLKRTFGKRSREKGALRWSGMIGDILTRGADVGAAPFTVDAKKERILDFSKPFLHSTFSLIMKSPESEDGLEIFFLEDVLNQTSVNIGVIRHSRVEKILKKSKLPLYKDVWSRIRQDRSNIVSNMENGLRRVRDQNFALIVESTDSAFIASQPPCDLISLDQFLSITHYSFAFKQGNSLVAEFDRALITLQQQGELQRLFHKWWNIDLCGEEGPVGAFGSFGNNISDVFPMGGPNFESDRIFITSPYEARSTTRRTQVHGRPGVNDNQRPTTNIPIPLGTTKTTTTTKSTRAPATTTTVSSTSTVITSSTSISKPSTAISKITTLPLTTPSTTTQSTSTTTVIYTTYRPRTRYSPWDANTQVTYDVIMPTDDRDRGYRTMRATPSSFTERPSFPTAWTPSARGKHKEPSKPTTKSTPVPMQDNRNINWFFATQEPRPPEEDMEEYDFKDEDTYYRISLEPDETVTRADGSQQKANKDSKDPQESHSLNTSARHTASLIYTMLFLMFTYVWTSYSPVFT